MQRLRAQGQEANSPQELREGILLSYDKKEGTREEIAHRYRMSLRMAKKLLQKRRRTGEMRARHHRSRPQA